MTENSVRTVQPAAECPNLRCRRARRCRHAGQARSCIVLDMSMATIPARLARLASIVLERMERQDG